MVHWYIAYNNYFEFYRKNETRQTRRIENRNRKQKAKETENRASKIQIKIKISRRTNERQNNIHYNIDI